MLNFFDYPIPTVTVTPWSLESMGNQIGPAGLASATYPNANRALFFPFWLYKPIKVYSLFVLNGTTANGNIDLGVYDRTGVRLCNVGTTAQTGTSVLQEVSLGSACQLGVGLFYLAIAHSNTTGTMFRKSPGVNPLRLMGAFQMASALPLPATATFAAITTSFLPYFGARVYA